MEEGSIGVEVLIVGLGWPTPTEDMEFWRPALGEPSFAVVRKRQNVNLCQGQLYLTANQQEANAEITTVNSNRTKIH